jgi:2-iminoacetate synthase ThiH
VTIQGGLDERAHFYYMLVRKIKQAFPSLHICVFSPREIADLHQRSREPYARIIERLSARIEEEGLKPM